MSDLIKYQGEVQFFGRGVTGSSFRPSHQRCAFLGEGVSGPLLPTPNHRRGCHMPPFRFPAPVTAVEWCPNTAFARAPLEIQRLFLKWERADGSSMSITQNQPASRYGCFFFTCPIFFEQILRDKNRLILCYFNFQRKTESFLCWIILSFF